MKKLIPILLAVFAFAACEKEPDMGKLDNEYLVYTNYDKATDFNIYSMYYIPDSIMIISNKKEPEYLKGDNAKEIIGAFVANMNQRGYTMAPDRASAELGIQVSYIQSTYYFTNYSDDSYWWNYYPGYWNPWYWGNWGGSWYYPYQTVYSYRTGAILADMVNLKAPEGKEAKLPVIWNTYITGLSYNGNLNLNRSVSAINQAFKQSPYITKMGK